MTESPPPRRVRIGVHQAPPGSGFTARDRDAYQAERVQIVVFPEYYWVRGTDADHRASAAHTAEDLDVLRQISSDTDWVVVGGTVVERVDEAFYNACPVFHHGREVGRYRKINLMPGEARRGIRPGEDFVLIEALGLKLAPVICADVLYPETFSHVAALRPDVILAPMSSPYRPDDTVQEKDERDRTIFLEGARRARTPIVKAGATGTLFGHRLQGRSLVATPAEILFRTPFDEEDHTHRWSVEVPVGGAW
jgi:predicted amidohydrolase